MGFGGKVGLGVIVAFALLTRPDIVVPLFVVVVLVVVIVRGGLRKRGITR